MIPSLLKKGLLADDQARHLEEIESRRLLSLHAETRALLYLGALLIVVGLGATVKKYIDDLGPLSIIGALGAAVAACYAHCFSKGRPYSPQQVEQPGAAFDYILYIGCALLGVLFGYIEVHYHLLDRFWDYYLLVSGLLFVALAYRFDNRLVLAAGLLNIGSWLMIRPAGWDITLVTWRWRAILFGVSACLAGKWFEKREVKVHFTDTFLNVGLHPLFWAMLGAVAQKGFASPYLPPTAVLAAVSFMYGMRRRRFQYCLYGIFYGYSAVSTCVLREVHGETQISTFVLFSSIAVVYGIFRIRRSLEEK